MVLKDDQTGLLVFTALGISAPARDSGLAGSRFVYGVRLIGGVFDEPFLIHGKCLRRQYGWIPQIVYDIPDLIDPFSRLHIPQPDWVMVFQGTGPIGELEGAGNVMVSVLPQGATEPAPPVALMNDGQIYSNVTASLAGGVLHTLSLNSGPALISLGLGAGGGVATRQRFFQSVETRLEPDLAIIDCQISDPFPAPGSRVKARVTVENQGLAGSPVDDLGKTGVGVEAVFVRDDGSERVAATGDVEPILPGETTIVTLDLEMPHDPVRVRVRLSPNPIDRSDANNSKECLFGAPAPGLLACERIAVGDVAETPAVDLSWTNAAVYDEIVIFRDGSMLASLPGGCQHFVDLYAPEETVEYAVRGRMGASKSVRTTIICLGESREPHFRRGDTDSNQQMQITDAIALLGFLFLGSAEPRCQDAADADDNGQVQITDAIRILGYLFLGGGPPAAPFPECGEDPTPDALPCSSQPGCP